MKHCPRCDALMESAASSCLCGWKDRKQQRQEQSERVRIPCSDESCPDPAICRIVIGRVETPLCYAHYEAHFKNKALNTCNKLGLDTIEKRRAWVQENMGNLKAKFTPPYHREPGEDEDYRRNA